MIDHYGNRPGHLKQGGSIGPAYQETKVVITRIASHTPGTEKSKQIEFEKDVRFIVEITQPNAAEIRLETSSILAAREFIIEKVKAGYTDHQINNLLSQIDWSLLS